TARDAGVSVAVAVAVEVGEEQRTGRTVDVDEPVAVVVLAIADLWRARKDRSVVVVAVPSDRHVPSRFPTVGDGVEVRTYLVAVGVSVVDPREVLVDREVTVV